MERWERAHRRVPETANPSFSSSLLDAIYRSIDEGDGNGTCRGTNRAQSKGGEPGLAAMKKQQYHHHYHHQAVAGATEKFYTSTVVETKKTTTAVTEKVVLHRHGPHGYNTAAAAAATEHDRHMYRPQQQRDRYLLNSTSSSSESSYGGFSSSEAESVVLSARAKPVRVAAPPPPVAPRALPSLEGKKSKQESSIRSRFRASKIYGELKKAKAPVSPGARLASFLNTLFTSSGHPKKAKTSSSSPAPLKIPQSTVGEDSTCSSASSYSRSCLSKTPSSRGKPGNGVKRSVRFYPVSVIVGDDLRPCGQKCVYEDYSYGYGRLDLTEMPPLPAVRVRNTAGAAAEEEERRRAGEAARDLINRGYNGKRDFGFEEDDDEEDDDAASYSSSDLFELENLTALGGGVGGGGERYRDELPVYETTHLHTNRAIAQGLIV